MKLKKCTCGSVQTTKTARKIGRWFHGTQKFLMFNCSKCHSTFILAPKNFKLESEAA